jgi:heme-degrading monooxygenase HmoA
MFARITTFGAHPTQLEPVLVVARERILRSLEELPGFAGIVLLAESAAGMAFAISFWKTEDDLAASETPERQLIEATAQAFEISAEVRNCEVSLAPFGSTVSV